MYHIYQGVQFQLGTFNGVCPSLKPATCNYLDFVPQPIPDTSQNPSTYLYVYICNNIFSGDLLAPRVRPPFAALSSEYLRPPPYPAGHPADVCPEITGTCKARIMAAVNRNYAVVLYCDLLGSVCVVCNKLTPPAWR